MNSIFNFTENNGEVIITGLKEGISDTSIVISETIDGMPVTAIGTKAFRSTSIVDIKIGENIREIENEAFYSCEKLSSVTWNHKCDVIPDFCFFECSNLTQFDFSGIKKIGQYAFRDSGLQEVCLPKNIECISEGAFNGCSELHSVTWNCTCDVIPADCFVFCLNLTNFDFSGVKKIENHAFSRSGLQVACLPQNIECISEWTFGGCSELRSVTWNCTCDVIPADCFSECSNLTNFDFSNIKKIGRYAFWESGLQEICLPKSIEILEEGTFSGCSELQSVTWNCTCDVIPASCFAFCSNLTNFDFSGVKKIENHAFSRSGLQVACLPQNIECISEWTFGGCSELRSVTWNCTCDVIPAYCFYMCPNLTNFDFTGIKKIEQDAFWKSGLISVTLSKGTAVYQNCFAFCESLTKVEWLSARNIEGNIFAGCKNIKEIYISDKVKNIEANAFVSSPNAEITFV